MKTAWTERVEEGRGGANPDEWLAALDALGPFAESEKLAAHLASAPERADTRLLAAYLAARSVPAEAPAPQYPWYALLAS
jgi:hypothetical protein